LDVEELSSANAGRAGSTKKENKAANRDITKNNLFKTCISFTS
jgi:hypothetical protein